MTHALDAPAQGISHCMELRQRIDISFRDYCMQLAMALAAVSQHDESDPESLRLRQDIRKQLRDEVSGLQRLGATIPAMVARIQAVQS